MNRRRAFRLASVSLVLALSACSSFSAPGWLWPFGEKEPGAPAPAELAAPPPATPAPTILPSDAEVLDFHDFAEAFYQRLTQRRFNTLATFEDPKLRGYFETQEGYSDYYARLAQDLETAHFEKNKPLEAELQEFVIDAPQRARVRYRLVGKSGLPLRFWNTSVEREDSWVQSDGRWWIVPGKL